VRFIVLAIFLTGDLLRECAFSSRRSTFDQDRRFRRPARLIGIAYLSNKKPRLEPGLKYHLPEGTSRPAEAGRVGQGKLHNFAGPVTSSFGRSTNRPGVGATCVSAQLDYVGANLRPDAVAGPHGPAPG
jgi:hypothetical protein